MKTLILVRHAKSLPEEEGAGDFERSLSSTGKTDAKNEAGHLVQKNIPVDMIISSDALRAKMTAEIFEKELKKAGLYTQKEITWEHRLYLPSYTDFYAVLSKAKKEWNTIAVFSHNEGITAFANSLTAVKIDNIPTSGIFAVRIHADKWTGFDKAEKTFLFCDYPKMHRS